MKKLIIVFLIVLSILPIFSHALDYSAKSYIVMEMNSGRVIYGKDIHKKRLIASITKIMTAIIAVESGKMDDIVKVDDIIFEAYGSNIYIEINEEIALRDLVYGLMLRSGNDAALVIGKYVSGSVDKFVEAMNSKAKEIGMENTIFANPHGLDEKTKNYSTAYDMAILTSYANKSNDFKMISGSKKHTAKSNLKTYVWTNKNKLLSSYKYTTGGKTGFTDEARRTLVTTASKNNLDTVVVTLDDPNDWNSHKSLHEYTFNNYKNYKIIDSASFKVFNDTFYIDRLVIESDFYYPLKKDEINQLETKVTLEKKYNYRDKEKVGSLDIMLGDQIIGSKDIFISMKKEKKLNFFDKLKRFLNL